MATGERALAEIFRAAGSRPRLPPAPHRFLLYGAGSRGKQIRRSLERHGYSVAAFVDRAAPPDHEVDGLPCYPSASREPLEINRAGVPVILCIWRHDIDLGAVADDLRGLGYRDIHSVYEAYHAFPDEFTAPFWLGPVGAVLAEERPIQQAFSLLGDEKSRQTFIECLRLRLHCDINTLRDPDRTGQYFPADVFKPRAPLRMIDGGAFTGDTYRTLRSSGIEFETYAGFEPDPANFTAMAASFRRDTPRHPVTLYPCGVWSHSEQLRFNAGAGDGSHVDPQGSAFIQVVALDDALPGSRPDFIKLDVEGAEPDALAGAGRLIAENRPYMAVAAYHRPDHLWRLLLQLHSMDLGYEFRMRYHWFTDFEVDLYALPKG